VLDLRPISRRLVALIDLGRRLGPRFPRRFLTKTPCAPMPQVASTLADPYLSYTRRAERAGGHIPEPRSTLAALGY
jgi:hypothetical protein